MSLSTRSPRVVGAHYYARFGFDEALSQVSVELSNTDKGPTVRFWREVLEVLKKLRKDEMAGRHPCAPLVTAQTHNQLRRVESAKVR